MHTLTRMRMTTETDSPPGASGGSDSAPNLAFLTSLQLSDTFFPTGLYTLSHGLESFVQARLVSKSNLVELLLDYLESVLGSADTVAVSLAHRATEDRDILRLMEIDRQLFLMKLAREARESSRRVGKRILTTAIALNPNSLLEEYRAAVERAVSPGNSAVALGAVTATLHIARREAMLIELYTFTASVLGAAMRLIRLDHEEAQRMLTQLKPRMIQVVQENQEKGLQDMRAFAPLIDIMGMEHERARIRLFIS